MKNAPSFGVVTINWNGEEHTVAALDSLAGASPRPAYVVVVDNGSRAESVARVREWCALHASDFREYGPDQSEAGLGWLTIVRLPENRGFAGGNNVGLELLARHTDVTHFVLLNNDAMIEKDYFARMAEAIEACPDAGVLGCAIYHHPQRERLWFGGMREVRWRALLLHETVLRDAQNPYDTQFITGCAMAIARDVYDAIGGIDEVYNPAYWEDSDYTLTARRAGWRAVVVPLARVYHVVGATGGGERISPAVARYQNRNRVIFVRRNYSGLWRVAALGYLFATKPARALLELVRGNRAMASAIAVGYWRGLTARTR